jgi:hypothetical protein
MAPALVIIAFPLAWKNRNEISTVGKCLSDYKSVSFWMMMFFVSHVIGIAWSEDIHTSYESIGRKLSLLAFPVIFAMGKRKLSLSRWIDWVIDILSVITVFLLINAAVKSVIHAEDNHWAYFLESEFSAFIHRSYWATYCAIGSSWSLYQFMSNQRRLWRLFTFLILAISVLFTISKAGILILLASILFIFFLKLRIRVNMKTAVSSLVLFAMIVLFIAITPQISSRFGEIFHAVTSFKRSDNMSSESNVSRLIMWSSAMELIGANGLSGVGTGCAKEALLRKNVELNNLGVAAKKLDAHSQFLNSWLELGALGFLFLTAIFFSFWRSQAPWLKAYSILMFSAFFITMLFESYLENQAGIIPFCFLFVLFSQKEM